MGSLQELLAGRRPEASLYPARDTSDLTIHFFLPHEGGRVVAIGVAMCRVKEQLHGGLKVNSNELECIRPRRSYRPVFFCPCDH